MACMITMPEKGGIYLEGIRLERWEPPGQDQNGPAEIGSTYQGSNWNTGDGIYVEGIKLEHLPQPRPLCTAQMLETAQTLGLWNKQCCCSLRQQLLEICVLRHLDMPLSDVPYFS